MVKEKVLNFCKMSYYLRLFYYFFKRKNFYHFSGLNLDQHSIVLDIGANVGNIAQFISDKYHSKIYCYEPNKYAFKLLKKKFSKIKRVKVFNKAVTEKKGIYKLYIKEAKNEKEFITGSQSSSLLKQKENISKNKFLKVKSISIGSLLKKFNYIDLIKIDIEGYEYRILPIILKNKHKINKVVCELHGNPKYNQNKFLEKKYFKYLKIIKILNKKKKFFIFHT